MNGHGINILLVEDNPQDVELILRALQKKNLAHHVQVARDGAEALEILLAVNREGKSLLSDLRVILLDLKLPKVSGLEVLQKIKNEDRTKAIPVVVLTSSPEESDIRESYRLGANSYVVKPVEFDNFTDAVTMLASYWLLLNKTSPDWW
jgi:CheY-like chemotaxis protein